MDRAKADRNSPMNATSQLDGLRSAAEILLERETRRTGSKMRAYDSLASLIGASASWLRKFIGRSHEAKEPRWIVGQSIMTQYDRFCSLIEAEQATERARNVARRAEINAALGRTVEAMARETRGVAARAGVAPVGLETIAPETETGAA